MQSAPTVYVGDSIINLYCMEPVQLMAYCNSNVSFSWTPPDGLSSTNIPNPIATITQEQTYVVTVVDSLGCTSQNTVEISIPSEGYIFIPNAFSPTADGVNDIFLPLINCPIKLEYFRIYNRWGEKVFETNMLGEGWDGIYNDMMCSIGVYVYVLRWMPIVGGHSFMMKGNVTLVR